MALHFTCDEFAARQRRACEEMQEAGLEGLLIFRQESMYYLTGYDTSGYSMFQGMYLRADGALALLTRSADQRQARLTSVIEDIRIWTDREGADPAAELRDIVADYGGRGKRIGVEYHAYGLTAQRGKMVDAAFAGFCELVDASDLVRLLRLVKSPAELAYFRQGPARQRGVRGFAAADRAGGLGRRRLRRDDEDDHGRRRRPERQPLADGRRRGGAARPLPHWPRHGCAA
jgi:Xaa-Pro dipeptidase